MARGKKGNAAYLRQKEGETCCMFNRRGRPCRGLNLSVHGGRTYCDYHHPAHASLRFDLHRQWEQEAHDRYVARVQARCKAPTVVITPAPAAEATNPAVLRRYAIQSGMR